MRSAERDEVLFMPAAKGADDVRDDKEYDRPRWRYVNYPFEPPGAGGGNPHTGPGGQGVPCRHLPRGPEGGYASGRTTRR